MEKIINLPRKQDSGDIKRVWIPAFGGMTHLTTRTILSIGY